jgi:hypothetical protein
MDKGVVFKDKDKDMLGFVFVGQGFFVFSVFLLLSF